MAAKKFRAIVAAAFTIQAKLSPAAAVCPTTEWVDPDTPVSACQDKFDSTGAKLELVFSDEFNVEGRTFQDGDDPRWTAITGFPQSNSQVNAYVDSSTYASTADGKLRLRADASSNRVEYFEHWTQNQTRAYSTPMLQTWNKFCFTEGVLEMSAQLPGLSKQPGLWPAFWIMGNLGRATAAKSTDKIWPFSYSHCPEQKDAAANQNPSSQQEINACRSKEWTDKYGLNERQGRGATEVDIVEAMPGDFIFGYKKFKSDLGYCPKLAEHQYALLESPRPMVATSLQLAPGLPFTSDQRPLEKNTKWGGSQEYNCVPSDWNKQWYPELKQGNLATYGQSYKSQPNVDFWGEYFKGDSNTSIDLQTDSLSSLSVLPHEAYNGQHVYQLDWQAGPDGYVEFNLDGKMQFRVDASTALREHDITKGGVPLGKMLGRQMAEEPSYIMLNIDLSTRWGWPDCDPKHCDCCSDCRDPKCTTCYYPSDPKTNARQWMADLCKTLPAHYEIDYVRLWQRPGHTRTSCSPKDYPTQGWVESHRDRYVLTNMNEPLRPVLAGGHQCTSNDECGGSGIGSCADGSCQCLTGWTGPRCLVKRSGASLVCQPLEEATVGGAACRTGSATDCGQALGRGECVEVTRPGGQYAANQTHQSESGAWEKVGGGDGRCQCRSSWSGATCNKPLVRKSCNPTNLPNPAWMGSDLEAYVEKMCSQANSTADLAQACHDVLWKPHWEQGGVYAGCGSWLRAVWVAKAAACGLPKGQWSGVRSSSSSTSFELWPIPVAIGAALVGAVLLILTCRCLRRRRGAAAKQGPSLRVDLEKGSATPSRDVARTASSGSSSAASNMQSPSAQSFREADGILPTA